MKLYRSNASQLVFSLAVLLLLTACSPAETRVASGPVTGVSGRWNDSDSRLVAREMVKDVLSRDWLKIFKRSNDNKAPTVIVGAVHNLSHEHINTRTFIADLERELINSSAVEYIASAEEREEIRQEVKDQDLHATAETRKTLGQEIGADFMLQGSINAIVDVASSEQARVYQVDLTLIQLAGNRKVWVGQKRIKKKIKKAGSRL